MRADVPQHGVDAAQVECTDVVVVQRLAVDGPDGRNGGRHLLLVLRELLQLVERYRLGVERAGQAVDVHPRADHQRRVVVVGHRGVFRGGVGFGDALDGERVGGEERAVDVVVAFVDFVDLALCRADSVLENAVAEHQFAVGARDAVHLGRIEEVGEEHVGDGDEDESDEHLAQQPVGPQPEGGRHHLARNDLRLMRKELRLVCEGLGIEYLLFSCHDLKNWVAMVQI